MMYHKQMKVGDSNVKDFLLDIIELIIDDFPFV